MLGLYKKWLIKRRMARIMKPDPDYRIRRLAQFSAERQYRYWDNVRMVYAPSQTQESR